MLLLPNNIWSWLKKNWKWIFFPVGLLCIVASVFITLQMKSQYPAPKNLDKETRKTLEKIRTADRKRNGQLIKLEQEHKNRLKKISQEQKEQIIELQNKPIEEVVLWFNAL